MASWQEIEQDAARIAMHSPTIEPTAENWPGDAKLAGTAVELPAHDNPSDGSGHLRLEIAEVTLTYVGVPADHLVIETWHPGRGHERRTRK